MFIIQTWVISIADCLGNFTVYPCKPVSTLTFVFGNVVSIITAGGAIFAWIAVTWVDLNITIVSHEPVTALTVVPVRIVEMHHT